jgi:hypothetical protein
VVVSGRSTNARSWLDPDLNNPGSGIIPRYFTIFLHSATAFGTRGARRHEPDGGKTAVGTSQNPSAPKKGVGKGWLDKGIPADFCDDGAGKWLDFKGGYIEPSPFPPPNPGEPRAHGQCFRIRQTHEPWHKRAKPLPVPAKTQVRRKRGSAKGGLARGYRLTFVIKGLGWGDLSQCCDATKKIQELFF